MVDHEGPLHEEVYLFSERFWADCSQLYAHFLHFIPGVVLILAGKGDHQIPERAFPGLLHIGLALPFLLPLFPFGLALAFAPVPLLLGRISIGKGNFDFLRFFFDALPLPFITGSRHAQLHCFLNEFALLLV